MADNRHVVTVTESIWIDRSPEDVWDYTQDFARRTEWDGGVSAAKLVETDPRTARVRVRNLGTMTVVYRLDRRPERTSAAFDDVDSAWVSGGGGSWQYLPENGGTRWEQTNSLELKRPWLGRLIGPLLEQGLRRSTRVSMDEAKRRLESEARG